MTYTLYKNNTAASTEDIRNVLLYSIWQRVQGGTTSTAPSETGELIKQLADLVNPPTLNITNHNITISAHDLLTLAIPANPNRTSWLIQNPPVSLVTLYLVAKTEPFNNTIQQTGLPTGYFYLAELLPGQFFTESSPNSVFTGEIYCMTKWEYTPGEEIPYPQIRNTSTNQNVIMTMAFYSFNYLPIVWEITS